MTDDKFRSASVGGVDGGDTLEADGNCSLPRGQMYFPRRLHATECCSIPAFGSLHRLRRAFRDRRTHRKPPAGPSKIVTRSRVCTSRQAGRVFRKEFKLWAKQSVSAGLKIVQEGGGERTHSAQILNVGARLARVRRSFSLCLTGRT